MATKVALAAKEPPHQRMLAPTAPPSKQLPRHPAQVAAPASSGILDVSDAAKGGADSKPAAVRLVGTCPPPRVLSCDTSVAHLAWDQPSYVCAPPEGAAWPRLVARAFKIDWAELPGQAASDSAHILEDAWQALPSGDVCVPEVQVAGLKPGRAYAIRIHAVLDLTGVNDQAWEVVSQCSAPHVLCTLPSVPSPVKPPLLVARDRKSLKVKWNVPEEVGGEGIQLTYQLFISPAPLGWAGPCNAQGFVAVYQGPERSCKVSKLVPGARYSFWVLASNSVGVSEPGQVATYTTQATVPAQPDAPRPVSCMQSSVTLQWVAPPGNGAAVSNYVLERDEGATLALQHAGGLPGATFSRCYAGPLQTVMVGGLHSGLHYRFRLRAENDEGASFWSDFCLATPAPSVPGPPHSVLVSALTRDSATISWAPPLDDGGAPVTSHEVAIQAVSKAAAESMGPDWLRIFEGHITACTISSLRPGCTYRVRVRCANGAAAHIPNPGAPPASPPAGWGQWCLPAELTTLPDVPGAPGAPAIQQSGTAALTLTWQPPRHDGGQRLTAFVLELLPPAAHGPGAYTGPLLPRGVPLTSTAHANGNGHLPRPQPPQQQQAGGDTTSQAHHPGAVVVYRGLQPEAHVPGLQPGLPYQFRVQACNALGCGPWGEWATLGTAPAVPAAPPTPAQAAKPTSTALRVQWQPPDPRGAPVTSYLLQLMTQGRISSSGRRLPPPPPAAADGSSAHSSTQGSAADLQAVAAAASITQQGGGDTGAGGGDAHTTGNGHTHPSSAHRSGSSKPAAASDPQHAPQQHQGASSLWPPAAGQWQLAYRGAQPSAEVLGLQPSTRYLLRAAALNAVGQGGWSASLALCTAPAPPCSPVGVVAYAEGPDRVRVVWQLPACDHGSAITHYLVDLAPASAAAGGGVAAGSPGGAAAAGQVVVREGKGGAGGWQQVAMAQVPLTHAKSAAAASVSTAQHKGRVAAVGQPEAPQTPGVAERRQGDSATTAAMPHSCPPGQAQGGLQQQEQPDELVAGEEEEGDEKEEQQSALVHSLQPGQAYWFRVRAVNGCGASVPCCTLHAVVTEAAAPSAPLRLAVAQRGAEHVRARWEAPAESNGASVTDYRLELLCLTPPPGVPAPPPASDASPQAAALQQEGEAPPQAPQQSEQAWLGWPEWEPVHQGPEQVARVHGLRPGCRYALRCLARNCAGWGPHGTEERFTTALAPPGPPKGVEACLVALGGACRPHPPQLGVQLRWQPPAPCASQAPPASYEVHAVPVMGPSSHGHELRQTVGRGVLSHTWLASELQAGTRYALRVRAAGMEGAGHGPWSDPAAELLMPGVLCTGLGQAGAPVLSLPPAVVASLARGGRGVTDSADSMSAESGGTVEGLASLLGAGHALTSHHQQLRSAVLALKQQQQQHGAKGAAQAGRGGNGKSGGSDGMALANKASAGSPLHQRQGGLGRAGSGPVPTAAGAEPEEDVVSVASGTTGSAASGGLVAAGTAYGGLLSRLLCYAPAASLPSAPFPSQPIAVLQQQQARVVTRGKAGKVQQLAVAHKPPRGPLQLGRELRQLMSLQGLRRAHRAAGRACAKLWTRYSWQLLALLAVMVLAGLVQWAAIRLGSAGLHQPAGGQAVGARGSTSDSKVTHPAAAPVHNGGGQTARPMAPGHNGGSSGAGVRSGPPGAGGASRGVAAHVGGGARAGVGGRVGRHPRGQAQPQQGRSQAPGGQPRKAQRSRR